MDLSEYKSGEMVEHELDAMIRRRDAHRRQSEEQQRVEDAWAPSVRLHAARREAENRAAWCAFHEEQAARIERAAATIAAQHRARAARLQMPDEIQETA